MKHTTPDGPGTTGLDFYRLAASRQSAASAQLDRVKAARSREEWIAEINKLQTIVQGGARPASRRLRRAP